jgi:phage-related protein
LKPVVFIGRSREDLGAFPKPARVRAGRELFMVQVGRDPENWKPMSTVGRGVREIRVRDATGAFRVIYIATLASTVYVLHAFQKKTPPTTSRDIELARRRLKEAVLMERVHEA